MSLPIGCALETRKCSREMIRNMGALYFALLFGAMAISCNATQTDVEALLAIKDRVGSNNINLDSWKNGTDPCSGWYGVLCTSGNVTTLNLTKGGLLGTIPTEIGNLVYLQVLDLQSNSLTGDIPASFSNLVNLQALNLSRNTLGVQFPSVLLSMTNLVDIRCGGCTLTGQIPKGIGKLTSLQFLHINNNSLSGNLPEELYTLPKLSELNLWGNPFKINLPIQLGYLKTLTFLKMHQCELNGTLPTEWATNFTNLNTLWLSDNKLQGEIPDTWGSMKSLSELKLSDNRLSGSVPSWLENAVLLNTDLSCNFLTGPKPTLPYSKYKKVTGNCYTGEPDTRKDSCQDHQSCNPTHHIQTWVIIVIVIAILCVIVPIVIFSVFYYLRSKRRHQNRPPRIPVKSIKFDTDEFTGLKDFSWADILNATNEFSKDNEIGSGGFGKVYLGHLRDGRPVAIKQAYPNNVLDSTQFENELRLLSRLHHRHLVRLIGWCCEGESQILVYEYMKNGNLQELLLGKKKRRPLNFYERIEIAVSVARGLDYLHSFADPPVIHRDLKPSNILLDDNLVAKISDFGISKDSPTVDTHVSTRPAGTAGYLDPEYFLRQQLTTASDVYAFGVILLQLVTGQEAIDQSRTKEVNLVEWVRETLKQGVEHVVDPRLGDTYPKDVYHQIAVLGLQCSSYSKHERPSLKDILRMLETLFGGLTKPEVLEVISIDAKHESGSSGNPSKDASSLSITDNFGMQLFAPR